jgi:hypothetical protein
MRWVEGLEVWGSTIGSTAIVMETPWIGICRSSIGGKWVPLIILQARVKAARLQNNQQVIFVQGIP